VPRFKHIHASLDITIGVSLLSIYQAWTRWEQVERLANQNPGH